MKIAVLDNLTVGSRPLPGEPLQIFACILYRQKLESLAYIFAADNMGLIFIQIFVMGSERCIFSAIDCILAVQGHPRLLILTNRKGVCDFLFVINSNFGPVLHHFWHMASYWLKLVNFSYPTLI